MEDDAIHRHVTRMSIDELLLKARRRLHRVDAVSAHRAAVNGATLIDIRAERQIAEDGAIPGALVITRNVLEWRLDPDSEVRHPQAPGLDDRVIVICDGGYQSSLVAAILQRLGFEHATDVIGGFQAWRSAGLPISQETVGGHRG